MTLFGIIYPGNGTGPIHDNCGETMAEPRHGKEVVDPFIMLVTADTTG